MKQIKPCLKETRKAADNNVPSVFTEETICLRYLFCCRISFYGFLAARKDDHMDETKKYRLETGSCSGFDVYQFSCHHPIRVLPGIDDELISWLHQAYVFSEKK